MTVDLEGFTYMRQDQKGVLLGIYEIDHEHWAMDGAPWDYGIELFQEQTDRIEKELTMGFERYPVLQEVGVKTWVNGAFTFSPDGNPLVGPVRGQARLLARLRRDGGLPAGRRRRQDAGRMDDPRRAEADAWSMDIARYGDFAENKRIHQARRPASSIPAAS
jgi:dimethylglycine dehydrogenase